MKLKNILYHTVAVVSSVTILTGCSVVDKVKHVILPQKEYNKMIASKGNEQQIETPTAVIEEIQETANQSRHAGVRRPRLSDKNLEGEWAIVSVYGQRVNLSTLPYIEFSSASGQIYCSTGCNVMNASYIITRTWGLTFDNLEASNLECKEDKFDEHIEKALSRTMTYSYSKHNGTLYLNFIDKKGATVMVMKQHNLNDLNGVWRVTAIDDKQITDERVRLSIDIQSSRLHGNSGCNIINGNIIYDSKKESAIQFCNIISTRKACKDMNVETDLLVALEEVEYYTKRTRDMVDFSDNKGNIVLTLVRASAK